MRFKKYKILINGRKTFYWQANSENKKVLVLSHGVPGNHKILIDMARHFSGFRVIIPDLPACGQSEPLLQEHILKNYVSWLNSFLEALLIDKATIIGYSFGSRVALAFCNAYEKKVEKLILITPVVKVDSLIARIASFEYNVAGFLPSSIKKMWLGNKVYSTAKNMIIYKSASAKRRNKLIADDEKEAKDMYAQAIVEIFNEFYHAAPISSGKKINTKTLLIAADEDEIATVESVKELLKRFSNAELKIIKKSGHIVPGERPGKLGRILNNWLAIS